MKLLVVTSQKCLQDRADAGVYLKEALDGAAGDKSLKVPGERASLGKDGKISDPILKWDSILDMDTNQEYIVTFFNLYI